MTPSVKSTFIYALSCPISGSIRYIGKADCISTRFKNHLTECKKGGTHRRNWIKFLVNQSLVPIIEVVDECSVESWPFWEQHYIDLYKSWGFNLVNSADGGRGGRVSYEANQKRIKSLQGKPLSEARKLKIRNSHLGKKASAETKAKMSAARRGIKRPVLSTMNAGGGNPRAKAVIQLSLDEKIIKVWECTKHATDFLCIRRGVISDVCRGKIATAAGFKWKFYNTEL